MGRAPCCDKANVKRGPWSPEEDATLKRYLQAHGTAGNWIALPQKAGLRRCGKSCRLRWLNYLRPDIKHGGFTEEEDNIICTLYGQMGSRWSLIASKLPGRTDNDVKNYWNTKLKKKLLAGKTSLLTIKNYTTTDINAHANYTNNPTIPCSSPSFPCDPKPETSSPIAFSDYSLTQSSVTLPPALSDIGSLDPFHLPFPMVMDMSEFGQEGSSISDSSSLAMETKSLSILPGNGDLEESGTLIMDSGFSFPCDVVNDDQDSFLQDKSSHHEVASTCYSSYLADFGYTDIKPPGQHQDVINQY